MKEEYDWVDKSHTMGVVMSTRLKRYTSCVVVLVVLGLTAVESTAEDPHLYVLSVGVEPSLSAQGQRDWYARDAHYMAQALTSAAPNYETVHSRILAGNRATRDRVLDALKWVAAKVGKEDVAIVFFSAHGELDSSTRFHIQLAHSPNSKLQKQVLRGAELRDALGKVNGRVIVLIDTCHAGALPAGGKSTPSVSYLVACGARELSYGQWDDPERAHGYFVLAVSEGLRGAADTNGDGAVSFRELASFVPARATELCPRQHAVSAFDSRRQPISLSAVDPAFRMVRIAATGKSQPKPNARPNPGPRRNPFGKADVANPQGEDVLEFAASVRLKGDQRDANARAWNTSTLKGARDKLDGMWESRWNLRESPSLWQSGRAEVKTVGDGVFILYQEGGSTYLIEARKTGDRLVGRYINASVSSDTSPWVGRIVSPDRIDGQWSGGRWDLRRRISD